MESSYLHLDNRILSITGTFLSRQARRAGLVTTIAAGKTTMIRQRPPAAVGVTEPEL